MPQSLSKLYIHLTFSTKNRVNSIDETIEEELWKLIGATVNNTGSQIIKIGGYKDHVHILFNLHRTVTVAKVVEMVKTTSSKWIKSKDERFQKFYWQNGYSAFSVNPKESNIVVQYISTQKSHHEKVSFQDECRAFFKQYGVEYDEQYVWD
jgi:REP element-mobilizing transposase RayT